MRCRYYHLGEFPRGHHVHGHALRQLIAGIAKWPRFESTEPPSGVETKWGWAMAKPVHSTQNLSADEMSLEEQVARLKQTVALLQAQLADVREQRDNLQRRPESISLVAPC